MVRMDVSVLHLFQFYAFWEVIIQNAQWFADMN